MPRNDKLKPLKDYLEKFATSVEGEMLSRLARADRANGTLGKSIEAKVVRRNNWYEIRYEMADYGVFVDKGVDGTKTKYGRKYKFKYDRLKSHDPILKPLQKWGRMRGIPKTAIYAVARSVKMHGIKPTPFFDISINRRRKEFERNVENIIFNILDGDND